MKRTILAIAAVVAISVPVATGCAAPASSPVAAAPSPAVASPAAQAPSPSVTAGSAPPDAADETRWQFTGTLPAGWSQDGDTFVKSDNAYVEILADRSVMAADCDLQPEAGIGRTADDIVAALAARDGLATSGSGPVTISGLAGQQLDIALEPGWTKGCPTVDDPSVPMVPLVGTLDDTNQWHYNAVISGEQYRYLLLDTPDGGNVLISVYAMEPERLADIMVPAMDIVKHLAFTGR